MPRRITSSTGKGITPPMGPALAYRVQWVRSVLGGTGLSPMKCPRELPARERSQGSRTSWVGHKHPHRSSQDSAEQHRQQRLQHFVNFAAPMAAHALAYRVFSEWRWHIHLVAVPVENFSFVHLKFIVSLVGINARFAWCIKNLIALLADVSKVCCLLGWCIKYTIL